jgi:hypothetical protein
VDASKPLESVQQQIGVILDQVIHGIRR